MKEVLKYIQQQKQDYEQIPFFQFVRDPNIDPRRRLAWAPYAAPFIMSFIDLNKYLLREEPTSDRLQEIINRHTYEDDRHWLWFLEDLNKLGFDPRLKFSEALKFLWNDETKASRLLTYQLCHYTVGATPIQKAILIETIEAAGNVQFAAATMAGRDLQIMTGQQYLYFADVHLSVETGRTFGSIAAEEFIANIQLDEATRSAAFNMIDVVFETLTSWKNDLLVRAKAHNIGQTDRAEISV
jgi:hypothetical protein